MDTQQSTHTRIIQRYGMEWTVKGQEGKVSMRTRISMLAALSFIPIAKSFHDNYTQSNIVEPYIPLSMMS
jgi:amino acid permease